MSEWNFLQMNQQKKVFNYFIGFLWLGKGSAQVIWRKITLILLQLYKYFLSSTHMSFNMCTISINMTMHSVDGACMYLHYDVGGMETKVHSLSK